MVTRAENATLTQVGPATVMGNLMRQYWLPALKSDELAEPDCAPVRVLLLGERLIAFRDSKGVVGLLAEACPHRGASLFFGRNEDGGLRCAYHGWKFDVHGRCRGMPLEAPNTPLIQRVRAQAYPCVERGGIVWAYMGPREVPPPLPHLAMNMGSPGEGRVDFMLVQCNWLQNLEGDVDVDHIPVLHGSNLEAFRALVGTEGELGSEAVEHVGDPNSFERPPSEVTDSAVGCTFACNVSAAARPRSQPRTAAPTDWWAVGQFMMPFYSMLPYGRLGEHWVVARVPMDDHHTMTVGMYAATTAIPSQELMFGPEPARLPRSNDWFGRFRLARNLSNDFEVDRRLAKRSRGAYAVGAGIRGQAVQDAAITQSMGPIVDRTQEHLCAGDVAVVQLRKRLLVAARQLAEQGSTPPGVDLPSGYRIKQGLFRTTPGHTWRDGLESSLS